MKRKYLRRGAVGACLMAATLVLSACSGDDDAGETSSIATEESPADVQLLTGPGVDDTTIRLGHLTDLSGAFGPVGKAYLEGANLFVQGKNSSGGICERNLELVVEDHGYDVQRAVIGYRKIKDDVIGMEAVLGGGMANALLPDIVKDEQLMSVLTWTGSLINGTNVFLPGSDYQVQLANGVDWAVEEAGVVEGDAIGFIGFTGEVGEDVLAGTSAVAEFRGLEVVDVFIEPSDTDFTGTISQLKNAGVKVVAIVATAAQSGTIFSTAEAQGLDVLWIEASPGMFDATLLDTPIKDLLESKVRIASGQAPWSVDSPAGQKVRDLYAAAGSSLNPQFGILTGYAQAEAFGQVLEIACEAGDLTRAGVLSAFASMDTVDTGGLLRPLDFSRGPGKSQSLETMILRPDSSVEGGLSEAVPAFTSEVVTDGDF